MLKNTIHKDVMLCSPVGITDVHFKDCLICLRLLMFTPLDDIWSFDSYEKLRDGSKSCLFIGHIVYL
jgi:hypothetical protein